MQLGYVGINYKNTDLSVRDKITFTDSGIADFMQQAEEAGCETVHVPFNMQQMRSVLSV